MKIKNFRSKKIFTFLSALLIITLTLIMPISAKTDVTLYNIYDSRDNNVVGYYTIRQIGDTSVYDIDYVFLFYTPFIDELVSMFSDYYIASGNIEYADDSIRNFLNNNLGVETNDLVVPEAYITSWVRGYITSIFQTGLSTEYQTLISYDSALSLQYNEGYDAGYSAGQENISSDYVEEQYRTIYNNAYAQGVQSALGDNESIYLQGFNDGSNEAKGVSNFFWGFFTAPFVFMSNLFNFKLFGIDFYQIVLGILTAVIVVFVLKFIISKGA